MSFRLRPAAEADIEAITLYIAEHNPQAAQAWYDDILRHCRQLGQMPGMGVARPDVRPNLRIFPVGTTSSSTNKSARTPKSSVSSTAPANGRICFEPEGGL